jgi:hypothetical protein
MSETELTAEDAPRAETSAPAERQTWFAEMERISEETGYFEHLGKRHWAFFHDDGTNLLVTFETIDDVQAREGQMPFGHSVARALGWSHLCLISDGKTWYRDAAVYGFMDRLVDDAFFEDFDRVVFYGAGAGGHAACAFAVAAPGATVLAISPRATLNPDQAGWDRRDLAGRRLDFTSRYGYAPDMIEGAAEVFVIFDPTVTEDAMHAALFHAPFVTDLRTRHLGDQVETGLAMMGVLPDLVTQACEGTLDRASFATLWRKRRAYGSYLRRILGKVEAAGRLRLAAGICRSVTERLNAPKFRRRLADFEARISKD